MQKVARIIGIVAIVGVIVATMAISFTRKTPNADKVWNEEMTTGSMEAENYYIIYSDIACPYCLAFENAIIEHQEEFDQYIADNDILVEIRASDFLYEYGQNRPIFSRWSAEATYCAKKEGKFWDFYDEAVTTVWNDYFKDGGKDAFSAINALGKDYWIEMGEKVGVSKEFRGCVENDETLDEVIENAGKTVKSIGGMPYFKFNNHVIESGFDLSWGWDYVKMYLDSGLKK